jgi:hypothetical protein
MSFYFILLGVFILILIIYYINNGVECFTNYTPEQIQTLSTVEITAISTNYNELKELYSNGTSPTSVLALQKKANIKMAFDNIEKLLVSPNDKYLLATIYYGNNKNNTNDQNNYYNNNYIVKYLDTINDEEFGNLMMKVVEIILNATKDNNSNGDINLILTDFNSLNDLYSSVYIDKSFNYEAKQEEISNITRKIMTNLLLITTYSYIYTSGIELILNTTLKRSYETSNLLEINNNINSFKEKLDILKNQLEKTPSAVQSSVIQQQRNDMPLYQSDLSMDKVKDDFSNINNAFELINYNYKNKNFTEEVFIANLINVINKALDNISNYYQYNNEYKNKVVAIKNTSIKSIIEGDLKNSYIQNDNTRIETLKTNFSDNINEIKNLIISITTKRTSNIDNETCLYNIIDAVSANNYPINVSNIPNCDKSLFNDKDIVINR